MAITPVPSMTPVPHFPALSERAAGTYNASAYAFGTHMADTFNGELIAVAESAEANAQEAINVVSSASTSVTNAANSATAAGNSAAAAASSASTAAASAGGQLWASGTTYAVGALVFSAVTGRNYRRIVAGAGTTDPSADSINWRAVLLDAETGLPTIRPSMLLDFANSKTVDPRITFTRASTATYFDDKGVMRTAASGVPRIDHDPATGACKGLLIEEARTNLLNYSEQFENAYWTTLNLTITQNAITAPDGSVSAEKIVYTSGASFGALAKSGMLSANKTFTFSFYAKAGEKYSVRPNLYTLEVGDVGVTVNLLTGEFTLPAGGPDSYGAMHVGDGWYRCWITKTFGSVVTNPQVLVGRNNAPLDGVSGIYIWGAQLEEGVFPTSYIPTTTAAVTRAAEIAYIPQDKLQAFTKPNSGTVFAEYSIQGFSKTTVSEHSVVAVGLEGGNYAARLRSYSNAVGGYDSDAIIQYPNYHFDSGGSNREVAGIKVSSAVSYGSKGATASVFGEFKGTHATPFTPAQHSVISLGNFYNTKFLNGHIRRVAYFPAELPITELNALTAI